MQGFDPGRVLVRRNSIRITQMLRISTDSNKRKQDTRKARRPDKVERACQPVVFARNISKCGQDDRAPRYPYLTGKIQKKSVLIRSIRVIRVLHDLEG